MFASVVTCARCAHIKFEVFDPEEEARHPDHTKGEDCALNGPYLDEIRAPNARTRTLYRLKTGNRFHK